MICPARGPLRKVGFAMQPRSTAFDKLPHSDRTGLTPEQRTLRAKLGAAKLWSQVENPATQTTAARQAFLSKFADAVDPDGSIRERIADAWAGGRTAEAEELEANFARRVVYAKKAHFTRLAFASSRARAARAARTPDDRDAA
jgi:hypothetical protein